jgi:CubicO group peptidase (beta-lactamase class C family)
MRKIAYLFLVLITTHPSGAQGISASLTGRLDRIALQDVPAGAPGIATAIIKKGKLVYSNWGGYANLDDSSRITPRSRFNIASNGKQFTALAVLKLEKEGKLRLTDDIRRYLPGLYPSLHEPLRIEHLLTHTSGIRDVYDLWALQGLTWWKASFTNDTALQLLLRQKELNQPPGKAYRYSNSNYILLALLIEKASGRSFREYTNELFQALGMKATAFETNHKGIEGPVARAYFNFGSWTTFDWKWEVCGDGNLFSTLEDQIRWEQILQGGIKTGLSRQLLRRSQELVNPGLTRQYGFGLEFGQYKGLPCLFHEGATGAWKATVLRFPAQGLSFLTLTNTGKAIPAQQTRQLADAVLQLEKKVPARVYPPAGGPYLSEAQVTGLYLTPTDFLFRFVLREGQLYLERFGRSPVRLEREGPACFRQVGDTAFKQFFEQQPDGSMQVTAYHWSHEPYRLIKLAEGSGDSQTAFREGSYYNEETGARVELLNKAGEWKLLLPSGDTLKAIAASPARLLTASYTLETEAGYTPARHLLLSGNRIRRLRFVRIE